jgi:hypothetical protein
MQPVNLIVNCTNRKKAVAPRALRARTLRAKTIPKRLDEWARRRATHGVEDRPAADLYAGDHWQVAQAIPREAAESGLDMRLWVCSAGYGLIRASDPVKPYSVTFAARHPDSVMPLATGEANGSATSVWWSGLCDRSASIVGPRSIADLAAREPEVPIIVVASEPYVRAMVHDLVEAVAALESEDLLSVLSGGADAKRSPQLAAYLLPADAHFEAVVGGTRAALNARIARLVFQHLNDGDTPTRPHLSAILRQLSSKLPPLRRFDRRRLLDDEVRKLIEEERRADPAVSKTRLLRKLRAGGSACEQARFSEIFSQALKEAGDGT